MDLKGEEGFFFHFSNRFLGKFSQQSVIKSSMNNKQQQQILAWLNQAYTMEKGVSQSLERELNLFSDSPEIQEQIKQRINESNDHANRLRQRIAALGGAVGGGLTDLPSRVSGVIADLYSNVVGTGADKMVKNVIANYATENLEAATYQVIYSAANAAGDKETADLAKSIMAVEQKDAQMIKEEIPVITEKYIGSLK